MAGTPKAFTVSFPDDEVARMYRLMGDARLPEENILPEASWDYGVDLLWLKDMRRRFGQEFDWRKTEEEMNKFHHYTVEIEGVTVHYIHEPSPDDGAVPLMLLHGWPGTFWDFQKIIEPLYKPPAPCVPSYNVVVPSLPGYGFSSQPAKQGWTLEDTARILNKLMTQVLGYKKYLGQGGDWGSYILRVIGTLYPDEAPLIHLNMFRCPPTGILSYVPYLSYLPVPFVADLATKHTRGLLLTKTEVKLLERTEEFFKTGRGYQSIQSTKPATIGYALADSPLSLLAYIGEKMYAWSDPTLLDPHDVLATVAIYYLTNSFASSVLIYKESSQVREDMISNPAKWRVKSKVGFTAFPYEIGAAPKAFMAACCNLVFYKERTKGGHFPALDNPKELVSDIREITSRFWWSEGSGKHVHDFVKPPGHG